MHKDAGTGSSLSDGNGFTGQRRTLPIAVVLVGGIGGLVASAVAVALYLGFAIAIENTRELVSAQAANIVDRVIQRLQRQLDPAGEQARGLAHRLEMDPGLVQRPEELVLMFQNVLAATPRISGLGFFEAEGDLILVPQRGSPKIMRSEQPTEEIRQYHQIMREVENLYWGPLTFDSTSSIQDTIVNVSHPVRIGEAYLGFVASVVSIGSLSKYLAELDEPAVEPFILYGRDQVLAHPFIAADIVKRDDESQLVALQALGDPVLAAIWADDRKPFDVLVTDENLEGHYVEIADRYWGFLFRRLRGYGETTLIAGAYIDLDASDEALERLILAGALGIGVLILAVGLALWLSRIIAWPVLDLAAAAERVSRLDLNPPDPNAEKTKSVSVIRELADARLAFERMRIALTWFSVYMPRSLVQRLVTENEEGAIASTEREITVMFTDLVGFTAIAERKDAASIAELLNGHFSIVNRCIEAEGGTIDKYIGDSVMAFWGAPTYQPDHALRAFRAAAAIRRAISADNADQHAALQPHLRMRVGVHSGMAVVGNIGSPERVNYTVVGDTVNVSNRLEAFGKEIDPVAECVIAVSATAVASALSGSPDRDNELEELPRIVEIEGLRLVLYGKVRLRGRDTDLPVYELREG